MRRTERYRFAKVVLIALLLVPIWSAHAEAPRLEGTWVGVISVRPAQVEIDFQVEFTSLKEGAVAGALIYPVTQPDRRHALDSVLIQGSRVEFSSRDEQGVLSSFRGELGPGGNELQGILQEGEQQVPFVLERSRGNPATASALVELGSDAAELKKQFNEDKDKVRLLMILSPSCGICKIGARLVQRHIAESIPDRRLRIYLVWEAIGKRDTREVAEKVSWLLADDRVRSFWGPSRPLSTAFKAPLGLQKATAWDVFLLFGEGRVWDEQVPPLDFYMHNLDGASELSEERRLNARVLAEEIEKLLKKPVPGSSTGVKSAHP